MISPEILNVLKSNYIEPSYAVLITDFKLTENCNNDKITLITEQINPHPLEVIKEQNDIINDLKAILTANDIEIPDSVNSQRTINSIIEKHLTIESLLDFDVTQGLFVSRVTGSISNEIPQTIDKPNFHGTITSNVIKVTDKDYPNYFNHSKFRIKNHVLNITLPKNIATFTMVLSPITDDINATDIELTEDNINNNKITTTLTYSKYTFDASYTFDTDITMKSIESVSTPMNKTIEIEFNKKYRTIPGIIVTTDIKDKNYTNYDLSFTHDTDNYYTGVTIDFKLIRNKINKNDINIIIIGDAID